MQNPTIGFFFFPEESSFQVEYKSLILLQGWCSSMPGVGSVAWSYMADRFLVAIAHCLFLHVCRPKLYTGKLQS